MNSIKYLPGSQRIVYEELSEMLAEGEAPSIRRITERTAYTERTVCTALQGLRACGLIRMEQSRQGCRARYTVLEGEC